MASKVDEVELGFLEKCVCPEELASSHFPSKVGGKPAWLDPVNLPSSDQLYCKECHRPCVFLLQIYAPLSDEPETYHRSLFVFMCTNKDCHKDNSSKPFRVLRCQLAKVNSYYPTDEEVESDNSEKVESTKQSVNKVESIDVSDDKLVSTSSQITLPFLCHICGCPAPNRCGQCRRVHYCSEYHQKLDWKSSHKQLCKKLLEGKIINDNVLYM